MDELPSNNSSKNATTAAMDLGLTSKNMNIPSHKRKPNYIWSNRGSNANIMRPYQRTTPKEIRKRKSPCIY